MNGFVSDYFVQLLPILIGAVFVAVIRIVAIRKDRIVLGTETWKTVKQFQNQEKADMELGILGLGNVSENLRDRDFGREAYDELIINGLLPKKKSFENIEKLAFERLGMADMLRFQELQRKFKSPSDRLALFVKDRTELLKGIMDFKGSSGVLLYYLAGYALSVRAM